MAVKKIQMRPPDNNYADVLHPETDTTMVLLPDGSVLQDQLVAPLASGSATALVIDMPGITSYTHGKLFQFIASANNNGAASTLKVGPLLARPIYLEGTVDTAPNLIAGKLYTVWADNTKNCFFLKASGSGNAVAADLLAGKTATTDLGNIVGTMPNNGSQNATLTITGSAKPTKIIPAGYTSGGTITAQVDPSQAKNIKAGVILGGVEGTLFDLGDPNTDYPDKLSFTIRLYETGDLGSGTTTSHTKTCRKAGRYRFGGTIGGRNTTPDQTFRIKLYINDVLVTQYEKVSEENNPPRSLSWYHTADLNYGDTIRMDGYCSHKHTYTFVVSSAFRKPDTSGFFD
jgi:hypothetical protein